MVNDVISRLLMISMVRVSSQGYSYTGFELNVAESNMLPYVVSEYAHRSYR
jgi:hypothetical protein